MTEVTIHPATLTGAGLHAASTPEDQAPPQKLKLRGTGADIEDVKMLEPCYHDTPMEEIKRRYHQDGVVLVKGLLPRDLVLRCRADYLSFVDKGNGMLKPGTDPVEGVFNPAADWRDFLLPGAVRLAMGVEDEGPFVEAILRSHDAAFYHEFRARAAEVLEPFTARLCGFAEPWCLPRSLLRCAVPGGETTPVHYDQIYLRAAPATSVTAWVPVGDVGVRGGGLIYLERAHDLGRRYEDDFARANAALPDEERVSAFNRNMEKGGWLDRSAGRFGAAWERAWLASNYEAGDVVFHTPYAIHAGAINEDPEGRIRVSTDLRLVDRAQPYDERWTHTAYSKDDPNVARKISVRPSPP